MGRKRKNARWTDLAFPPNLKKFRSPWADLLHRLNNRLTITSYSILGLVLVVVAVDSAIRLKDPVWTILSILVMVAVVVILVQLWRSDFLRWCEERRWQGSLELAAIDKLQGHEFEVACAELYKRLGYIAEVTKRSRDQGADIVLKGPEGTVVVQTKRQANPVGNWAVQEICAAKGMYRASHAVVVTNSTFTKQAEELAKANSVTLVDRKALAKMIESLPGHVKSPTSWSDIYGYARTKLDIR